MPLTGPMDSRSRPADIGPGVLRYKLNLAINSSGKLSRRAGHSALSFGLRSDTPSAVANWDHHRQGVTRGPFTLLHEITSPDNRRYLFDGTDKQVSWLDNDTSEWNDIITDGAVDSRWKIASLRDKVVLVNGTDPPRIHTIGDTGPAAVLDLSGAEGDNGTIVVRYQNVIVMMHGNLVQWSDFRDASRWSLSVVAPDSTIAGFKYLDDGDRILNAVELGGVLYIFTTQSIVRMFPQVTEDEVFGFHWWYREQETRSACLAYDNAVVSTGREIFWFGRNTIFWLNSFSSVPLSPDWLLKASGVVFERDTRLDPAFCQSPVAEFLPDEAGVSKEVHFYFPKIGSEDGVNNAGLILSFNTDSTTSPYQTADVTDVGFTALTTFSRTTDAGITCATTPAFIGASGLDYSLKQIGGVFYREYVTLIGDGPANDIPDASYATVQTGYVSELVFLMPFGWPQRDKILRSILLEHETADARTPSPNLVQCFVGNSYHLADPMDATCGVQFHDMGPRDMLCPDVDSVAKLIADGTRSDDSTVWDNLAEQGRHLYLRLRVTANDGSAPVGSDTAWSMVFLDSLTLPS